MMKIIMMIRMIIMSMINIRYDDSGEMLPEGKDAHLLVHVKFASPENGHGQQLSPSRIVLGVIFVNLSYMNNL